MEQMSLCYEDWREQRECARRAVTKSRRHKAEMQQKAAEVALTEPRDDAAELDSWYGPRCAKCGHLEITHSRESGACLGQDCGCRWYQEEVKA